MAKAKISHARKPKLSRVARDIQAGLEEIRRYLRGEKSGLTVAWLGGRSVSCAVRELLSARQSAGLSRKAVAEVVGVSATHIGRLETGKLERPRVYLLQRYAAAVGVDLGLPVVSKAKSGGPG